MKYKLFDFIFPKKKWTFYINGRTDVIFVHIPKTAGTSIRFAYDFNKPNPQKGIRKHYTSKEIITSIGREKWDSAFKFTIVRDPWERLYSFYLFQLRKKRIEIDDFKLFVLDVIKPMLDEPNFTGRPNIFPQVDWLMDENDALKFDFIGRFENLESDFKILSGSLNIETQLIHKNKSGDPETYKGYYDEELKEFVAHYYKKDIEAFGYSF